MLVEKGVVDPFIPCRVKSASGNLIDIFVFCDILCRSLLSPNVSRWFHGMSGKQNDLNTLTELKSVTHLVVVVFGYFPLFPVQKKREKTVPSNVQF